MESSYHSTTRCNMQAVHEQRQGNPMDGAVTRTREPGSTVGRDEGQTRHIGSAFLLPHRNALSSEYCLKDHSSHNSGPESRGSGLTETVEQAEFAGAGNWHTQAWNVDECIAQKQSKGGNGLRCLCERLPDLRPSSPSPFATTAPPAPFLRP
jgi:hypothetical protein